MSETADDPEQAALFDPVEANLRTVPLNEIEPTEGVSDRMKAAIESLGNVSVPLVQFFDAGQGDEWSYRIVDGRRRIAALRAQDAEEVEAYVIPPGMNAEADALTASMNIVREPNPLEEARSIAHLIEDHGYTPEALSRINIPKQTTKKRLRLWRAPDVIKEGVGEGEIAAGVAEKVANLSPDLQRECAEFYEEEGKLRHKDVTEIRQADQEEAVEGMGDELFDTPDVSRDEPQSAPESGSGSEAGGEEGQEASPRVTGVEVPQDADAFRDYIVIAGAVRGLLVEGEHESAENAIEAALKVGKKQGLTAEEVLALLDTAPSHFLDEDAVTDAFTDVFA